MSAHEGHGAGTSSRARLVTAAAIREPGAAGLALAKEALTSYLYRGGSTVIREALLDRVATDPDFASFARVACFTLTPVTLRPDDPTAICRAALDWVDHTPERL